MTPAEALSVQRAAAVAAAHLRGDMTGRDALLSDFGAQISAFADALIRLSVVTSSIAALVLETSPLQVLQALRPLDQALLPLPAADARPLAVALLEGQTPTTEMDVPTVVTSAFNLALAALQALAAADGRTPEQWAMELALGAALET
jgi:hypothetical protein